MASVAMFVRFVMTHIDHELEQLEDHIAGMDSMFTERLRKREAAATGNPAH